MSYQVLGWSSCLRSPTNRHAVVRRTKVSPDSPCHSWFYCSFTITASIALRTRTNALSVCGILNLHDKRAMNGCGTIDRLCPQVFGLYGQEGKQSDHRACESWQAGNCAAMFPAGPRNMGLRPGWCNDLTRVMATVALAKAACARCDYLCVFLSFWPTRTLEQWMCSSDVSSLYGS